jgi:hypothetical protein
MTRRPLLALAAAGVLASAAGYALGAAGDRPEPAAAPAAPQAARYTAPDRSFDVRLPEGWRVQAAGPAATVLARRDELGLVVVRRRGAVRTGLPRLGRHLEKRLERELPGARSTGSRVFTSAAGGDALLTTLVRGDRVHGVAVVPAGGASFSLDLLAAGSAPDAAREVAALVRSFRPSR